MRKYLLIPVAVLMLCSCGASRQVYYAYDNEDVDIGYGTVSKEQNTGSVSKVKMKQSDVNTYNNIYEYLQRHVPGVMVLPGDPPKICIRGIGSVNSSNDPLILIDGNESDVSYLAPADIESVEVIKDGSASIYGFRGANGVILIKTKQ